MFDLNRAKGHENSRNFVNSQDETKSIFDPAALFKNNAIAVSN